MHPSSFPLHASRRFVLAALLACLSASASARDATVEALRLALQRPDAEAAAALGERVLATRPRDAEAAFFAGEAFGRMAIKASLLRKPGWASKTREAFQQAVKLDPDHVDSRLRLVQFYNMAPSVMGGGKDKAATEIAAFSARDPAGGHYLRGSSADKPAQAESELRAAVKLAPDDARYRRALISVLERQQRDDDALAVLDAGLARTPTDPRLLYVLGRYAAMSGQRTEAGLAAMDRLLARPSALPDDVSAAGAHWRRGQLREKSGRAQDALTDYRRAAALAPESKEIKQDLQRLASTIAG